MNVRWWRWCIFTNVHAPSKSQGTIVRCDLFHHWSPYRNLDDLGAQPQGALMLRCDCGEVRNWSLNRDIFDMVTDLRSDADELEAHADHSA